MLLDPPRPRTGAERHTVAVYAFDGMSPFELGCVVEVFGLPRPELGVPWYELKVCAESAGPLRAVGGFTLARRLVLPRHREGGQAQFIEAAVRPVAGDDGVARSLQWALEHLAEPLAVADLARAARMSQRSYIRHFTLATGTSPLRWLVAQ